MYKTLHTFITDHRTVSAYFYDHPIGIGVQLHLQVHNIIIGVTFLWWTLQFASYKNPTDEDDDNE